ncbi:hypothetical protein P170DRAFT_437327 [Aspergillus steynii IBT 23096]|uniref:Uncharacterized protein n=1 Tax=Aspergillus steynii IBT 23096 TaxID=1392250 RepID=A0A2I2G3M3_9EURO|nr:uncharacterized protein P170DRAFT_437327 [Aspergillus steynii IBT 23096]PLB47478.1 hypothetical protein P170DRAFT_437327 [Aspergillus steynii IBT 23096]
MSWLFPQDFGDEYRQQARTLRIVALACCFLGLLFLSLHRWSSKNLAYLFPVIWSLVDGAFIAQQKTIHPLIRSVCDLLSVFLFIIVIPIMFAVGLLFFSLLTMLMGWVFTVAACAHGMLCFRAGVEFWRRLGFGGNVQLPV